MNVFRKQYRQLSADEVARLDAIKDKAAELYALFAPINAGSGARELAVAKTKLEESVMWAVKGLT